MPTWYKDLVGTRKEAKEFLTKFNAREESCSLMPVDGDDCAMKKSLHDFRPPSVSPPLEGGRKNLLNPLK